METIQIKPLIRRGDVVQIIAGREKKKTGKVLKVLHDQGRILVEGINLVKRHSRPTQSNPRGEIKEKEASLHYSNVLLLCPKCDRGVRVSQKIQGDKKVRICKKCDGTI